MIYLELREIDTVLQEQQLLAYAELIAFGVGECGIDGLPMDEALLAASFANTKPRAERLDLLAEPQFALQAAKEEMETRVVEAARANSAAMGDKYPFNICPRPGVLIGRKDATWANMEGLCYLSLQLHSLHAEEMLDFGNDQPEFVADPAAAFTKPFAKLFEVIAGIAVSNYRQGMPILTSECRSIHTLLDALQKVCSVAGRGRPKAKGDLNDTQLDANDGGIDAVIVKHELEVLHQTILVGATVQKGNLRNKMMGTVPVNRFRNFLVDIHSLGPISGSFAHPAEFRPHVWDLCNEANCDYFHKGLILRNLRPMATDTARARRCYSAVRKAAALQLRRLEGLHLRIGFDDFPLAAPQHLAAAN